jgi:quinolinate synthase
MRLYAEGLCVNYTTEELKEKIIDLKKRLDVTVVAHFYQRDEVFEMGDITGDSLELAKKTMADNSKFVLFCGVARDHKREHFADHLHQL